jgi:DNA-binding response OmpR family regulator
MTARILVAEDDRRQAQLLRRYLELEGHAVIVVHDGRAAIEQARRRHPDLLVLDVMMPKVDGLDVCRVLRREMDTPIILLTARSTEDDVLLGLDLGADDYVTKPYRPRELVARVRTLLRRHSPVPAAMDPDGPTVVGDLVIDAHRHRVSCRGQVVDCTPTEFRLLSFLASSPGRVYSRQELLRAVSGFDNYTLERTIDAHVRNLRRKLGDDADQPEILRTVYGVGYVLADPTETSGACNAVPHQPDVPGT